MAAEVRIGSFGSPQRFRSGARRGGGAVRRSDPPGRLTRRGLWFGLLALSLFGHGLRAGPARWTDSHSHKPAWLVALVSVNNALHALGHRLLGRLSLPFVVHFWYVLLWVAHVHACLVSCAKGCHDPLPVRLYRVPAAC